MLRSDIRTRVRDYLYETTANIWSDTQLNRLFLEELRSLPDKNIYAEELWTMSAVVDQQDYALPSGTVEVEKLERNDGTTSKPDWVEINGWDTYAGAIYLPFRPTQTDTYRIHIQKKFTDVEDDTTSLDISNEKSEVLVWGMVIRAYRVLIGYLRNSVSWDSVTKPGDLSIPRIREWLKEARDHYNDLLRQYATQPRPTLINLTS